MAEVIDLTKYIKKQKEKELDALSTKLADLIDEMGLKDNFEMYMDDNDNYFSGLPYIYTMYPTYYAQNYTDPSQVRSLQDITDVLTQLTLQLDEMGYKKWADQISNVVGEMFVSGAFREEG